MFVSAVQMRRGPNAFFSCRLSLDGNVGCLLQIDDRPVAARARVLLLEDEPLIAMQEEAILRGFGLDVVCARSADTALKALEGGGFDAALLDWKLGAESSLSVANRLREMGLPFGFLTGYQEDALPGEFRDCLIVRKPFTAEQLREVVTALMQPPQPRDGAAP